MLFIDKDEVFRLLTPEACINVMREALINLEKGCSEQFLRTGIRLPNENILGLMPAWLSPEVMGAKIISVYHKNSETGLPSHQGVVLLFDAKTGTPLCMVDGNSITQVRTGAVSAVATNLLARPEASSLALLGAGAQARSHSAALMFVRKIKEVSVYDQIRENAESFAKWAEKSLGLTVNVASGAAEAASEADIICTLTASRIPLLRRSHVKEGAHINAVGACSPSHRELDTDLVQAARFFGDKLESVMNEAGDFLIPMAEGAVKKEHFLGELGQLLSGKAKGRQNDSDITVFESLGLAVEDLAASYYVYQKKQEELQGYVSRETF